MDRSRDAKSHALEKFENPVTPPGTFGATAATFPNESLLWDFV
jgi:hypothetical protein